MKRLDYLHKVAKVTLFMALLLLCSAMAAFAQHGGSHGGGGGGSVHMGGGGGFHPSGGGCHCVGGGGAPRSGPSSPQHFAVPSYARPSGNSSYASANTGHAYANPGSEAQHAGNISYAPRGMADGQWHSFAGAPAARGTVASSPAIAPSGNGAGDFHAFSGNRSSASSHAIRSFSGQGNQVWENSSAARNVVPASHALSNIRSSFIRNSFVNGPVRNSIAGKSLLPPRTSLTANQPDGGPVGPVGLWCDPLPRHVSHSSVVRGQQRSLYLYVSSSVSF